MNIQLYFMQMVLFGTFHWIQTWNLCDLSAL